MVAIPFIALLLIVLYWNFVMTKSSEWNCECRNSRDFTKRHDKYLCQPWYESL